MLRDLTLRNINARDINIFANGGLAETPEGARTDIEDLGVLRSLSSLIDRVPQRSALAEMISVAGTAARPQAVFSPISGGCLWDAEALVKRFCIDDLPSLLKDTNTNAVRLNWPKGQSFDVGTEFRNLLRTLDWTYSAKGPGAEFGDFSPAAVAKALSGHGLPRVITAVVKRSVISKDHQELCIKWVQFWSQVAVAGLNEPLVFFFCLCEAQAVSEQPARASWFSNFTKLFGRNDADPGSTSNDLDLESACRACPAGSVIYKPMRTLTLIDLPLIENWSREACSRNGRIAGHITQLASGFLARMQSAEREEFCYAPFGNFVNEYIATGGKLPEGEPIDGCHHRN